MTHPAKPDATFDDLILTALRDASDDDGLVRLRPGEAASVLLLQGVAISPSEADAAIRRLQGRSLLSWGDGFVRVLDKLGRPGATGDVATLQPDGALRVYEPLVHSSIWTHENPNVKQLWLTLLMLCDANGRVREAIPGLAAQAGMTVDDAENVLAFLAGNDRIELRSADGDECVLAFLAGRMPDGAVIQICRWHSFQTVTRAQRAVVVVPAEWQPNETHRQQCDALGLRIDEQEQQFRQYPHTHSIGGWDTKFDRWLEAARCASGDTTHGSTKEPQKQRKGGDAG